MFTVDYVHVAFLLWGSVFCFIAFICVSLSKGIESRERRKLCWLELNGSLLLLADTFTWIYEGVDSSWAISPAALSNFFLFVFTDLQVYATHRFFSYNLGKVNEPDWAPVRLKSVKWLVIIGVSLIVISQFTDLYYYFDEHNNYYRTDLYPISMIWPIAGMLIDFSLIWESRKKYSKRAVVFMLAFILLPVIGGFLQLVFVGWSLANVGVAITCILIFLIFMVNQSRTLMSLQIDSMMSQIRPHFIYNTLTTIRYLCISDPEEAAKTIEDFSNYLRGNLSSLNMDGSIPFEMEKQHTESYVAIEQKRFGGLIHVNWNLEVTEFMLPSLTLQPLVENAIKHGITKKEGGGTITISTFTENEPKPCVVLKVEDNGAGFETKPAHKKITKDKDYRVHVGMENVQKRLRMMSKATMSISSQPGIGTCITIRIPISQAIPNNKF